jgi:6-phosphogluconolactonase
VSGESLELVRDAETLAERASELMAEAIHAAQSERGVARIALSGGTTPRASYRLLAQSGLALGRCRWFFVDERCVSPESDRSNYKNAKRDLFEPAGTSASTVHRMEGEREPAEDAARDYAALLCRECGVDPEHAIVDGRSAVRLDLVIAGMGGDGHTASLFPGTGAVKRREELVTVVVPGGELEKRITLTRPVLLAARRVIVLVSGAGKREALRKALVSGDEDEVPSRLYQAADPGTVIWLCDRDARG